MPGVSHLRLAGKNDDPRLAESEGDVLRELLAALDRAIEHPSLSSDWRGALQTSRGHLAACAAAEPPAGSRPQRRMEARPPG